MCSSFCFQCPSAASERLIVSDGCQEKESVGRGCVKGDGNLFFQLAGLQTLKFTNVVVKINCCFLGLGRKKGFVFVFVLQVQSTKYKYKYKAQQFSITAKISS